MTKKEAIMIIADQDNGNPAEIVAATEYLMGLEERKTGKWIKQVVRNLYAEFRCSECGRIETIHYAFGYYPTQERVVEKFPYCHCGAKMEVDE